MRNRKVRPGHKIAALLVASAKYAAEFNAKLAAGEITLGEDETAPQAAVPVSKIIEMFTNDAELAPTLYKLSGYVGDIRHYDFGVVKPYKTGRKVDSYELLNYTAFNDLGQNIAETKRLLGNKDVVEKVASENTVAPVEQIVPAVVDDLAELVEEAVGPIGDVWPVDRLDVPSEPVEEKTDTLEVATNSDPTFEVEVEENVTIPSTDDIEALVDGLTLEDQPKMDSVKIDRNARRRAARAAAKEAEQLAA